MSHHSLDYNLKMALRAICLIFIFQTVYCADMPKKDGILDSLSNGMKFAKDFLGSESVALRVAEFVVKAFQTANKPSSPVRKWPQKDVYSDENSSSGKDDYVLDNDFSHDVHEPSGPLAPLKHLVKLFGLQPNQISAVAVNALVFVAQMISTFLAGPRRPSKPYRNEDPMAWILNKNSRKLQELIAAAKNESLPDDIEQLIKEQGTEEETSCIRLLVCKITPYINRMQKAVFGNVTDDASFSKGFRGAAVMYRHLPTAEEIDARSDICEEQHVECDLNE